MYAGFCDNYNGHGGSYGPQLQPITVKVTYAPTEKGRDPDNAVADSAAG